MLTAFKWADTGASALVCAEAGMVMRVAVRAAERVNVRIMLLSITGRTVLSSLAVEPVLNWAEYWQRLRQGKSAAIARGPLPRMRQDMAWIPQ